jgi:hypothetical protein
MIFDALAKGVTKAIAQRGKRNSLVATDWPKYEYESLIGLARKYDECGKLR